MPYLPYMIIVLNIGRVWSERFSDYETANCVREWIESNWPEAHTRVIDDTIED
jgi:hypothetical protein